MGRLKLATAVLVSLSISLAAASPAAAELFLEVNGVPGESQDARQTDSIDILSYSWGAVGGDRRRARLEDLSVVKNVDLASPLLFQRLVQGTQISSVELIARRAAREPFVYLRLCFQDVHVASIQQSGSANDTPTESVTFAYGAVSQQYTQLLADGRAGQSVFAGWNATTGRLIVTYPTPCGL